MTDKKSEQVDDAQADGEDLIETTVLPEGAAVNSAVADGAAAESGQDAPESDPLAVAEAKAEENWNKYLRVVAELDNVRKRAARDVEKAHLYGVERFAGELLEVADSLEMALETGEQVSAETLLEGSAATHKLLRSVMDKHGIAMINPEGEPFDPELHEAMSMIESATAEPDTVVQVVQRGYQLNGRLLRPARVIVAREPQKPAK